MIVKMQSFLDMSPFVKTFQMQIVEADKEAQTLSISMPFLSQFERLVGGGQFHGGSITSLIDTVGTFALVMMLEKPIPTINLRTDFIRPAMCDTLTATAKVRRMGRTINVVDIEVYSPEQELIAVGRGSFGT